MKNFLNGTKSILGKSKTTTKIKLTDSTIEFDRAVRGQSNSLVIGSIGFGKSMLMLLLMMADLAKRVAFCLIDLHGKLFRHVKNWCAYKAYGDRRIIIVDPSEGKYVKPYNPFRRRDGFDRSVQVGGMVKSILSVWGQDSIGEHSNIFKFLTILFTVIIEKEMPLLQGFSLLPERERMKKEVAALKDPAIDTLWCDLMKLNANEWSRQIAPTLTRLFRVICSDSMKRFLGQVDNNLELTFEDTILVNAGKGGQLDDDAANVFAALLINDLYQSSFRRQGKYGKDPSPYYVYVDEWWLLRSPSYKKIMFECRKQGLLLVLANHDLHQLRETFGGNFAESIHTMTQIKIIFGGITDSDVGRLSRELQVSPAMITSLEKQQCIIKVLQEPAELMKVPDVRIPHVSASYAAQWERENARKTGASSIKDLERRRVSPHNETNPSENDTEDGWAVQ
jgi:hypothetical protein